MTSKSSLCRRSAVALGLALLAACGDGPTGPEVIEDVDFAASLGIDLAAMTRLPSGVYIQDIVVGTGDPATVGAFASVSFSGWLTDGTPFDSGSFEFVVGVGQAIAGFDQGVLGMRRDGKRKIVIPPDLAYGEAGRPGIPPGSVLIFEVELQNLLG